MKPQTTTTKLIGEKKCSKTDAAGGLGWREKDCLVEVIVG